MEVSQRQPLMPQVLPEKPVGNSARYPSKRALPPRFSRLLFGGLLTVMTVTMLLSAWWMLNHRLAGPTRLTVELLEVEKCPACAGQSVCPVFYRGDVQFKSPAVSLWARHELQAVTESTLGADGLPATFGLYETARQVYLHRMGSPARSNQVDAAVCRRGPQQGLAGAPAAARAKLTCMPHLAIWRWLPTQSAADPHDDPPWYAGASVEAPLRRSLVTAPRLISSPEAEDSPWLTAMMAVSYSPATRCASDRLFAHLQASFRERTSYGAETRWLRFDELMFLFNLAIDPTGLLSQAFPPAQRWPFPDYLGACGRWVVQANGGVPIDRFLFSPMWLRLRVLASILHLPSALRHPSTNGTTAGLNRYSQSTSPTDGYTIYLTDIGFVSHLFVDPYTYNVTLADLRHVIVVDVHELLKMQPAGVDAVVHGIPVSSARHTVQAYQQTNSTCSGRLDAGNATGDAGGSSPPCLTRQHADHLCSHVLTDQNEWTVCAGLLAYNQGRLLADMPGDLVGELQRCAQPETASARLDAFRLARRLLASLVERNPMPGSW